MLLKRLGAILCALSPVLVYGSAINIKESDDRSYILFNVQRNSKAMSLLHDLDHKKMVLNRLGLLNDDELAAYSAKAVALANIEALSVDKRDTAQVELINAPSRLLYYVNSRELLFADDSENRNADSESFIAD